MNKKIVTLLTAFCLLSVSAIFAAAEPLWTHDFGKKVNWVKVSETGTLIVGAADGLYGVKGETGEILWTNNKLKDLIVETYEAMPNTPYIIITPEAKPKKAKTGFGALAGSFSGIGAKPSVVIINSLDGAIVCDTKELGLKQITAQYSLPKLNAVVFEGIGAKGMLDIFYDFNTNTKVWEKTSLLGNKTGTFGAPVLVDDNTLLWTSGIGYSLVSAKTGDISYSAEIKFKDKDTPPQVVFNEDRSVVYFINKKLALAYNISDGSKYWKEPVEMEDPPTHVFTDSRGIYIAVPKYMNLYDYKTGAPKWGEDGVKLSDPLLNYVFLEKGLGIQLNEKTDFSVNVLDYETGKPLVKKNVELDSVAVDLRMVAKGLLYRTAEELNVLDAETGKPVFKKPVKFKPPVIAVDNGDITYLFGKKELVKVNNADCTFTTQDFDSKFEGGETPSGIELRNGNILLKSSQNLSMFDLDGKPIYHAFYKAPGISFAAKIALAAASAATMAAGATMSAQAGFKEGATGMKTSETTTQGKSGASLMGASGAGFSAMGKRFNATKEADGFVAMLTVLPDGVGVIKVNKDSGKKENEVVLKEKEPVYEIDDLGGMLYFKSKKTEISGFKF